MQHISDKIRAKSFVWKLRMHKKFTIFLMQFQADETSSIAGRAQRTPTGGVASYGPLGQLPCLDSAVLYNYPPRIHR